MNVLTALFTVVPVALCLAAAVSGRAQPAPPPRPALFLTDAEVAQLRDRVASGPPWSAWADAVVADADKHVDAPRPSVVQVGQHRPNGSPHDFWTQLPYQHGSAQRDGIVNPAQDRADYEAAIALGKAVRTLGLAYVLTSEARYADAARDFARVWCLDPATRMTPAFTNNQSRIELCITLPGFFYGLDLVWDAPGWDEAERAALRDWAGQVAKSGRTWESGNNFGNWRVVLLASAGAFAGDDEAVDEAFASWKRLLYRQVDDAGFLPEEMRRTKSLFYATYALSAMVQGAELARRRGVDLYGYVSPRGRNLRDVLVHHARFVAEPAGWPGPQISPYDGDNAALFELAAAALHEPAFEAAIARWGRPLHEPRTLGPVSLTHGRPDARPSDGAAAGAHP